MLLCACDGCGARGAETNGAATNLVRQINADTWQIGLVRVESKKRRLVIPATVNMVEGLIEYVLVSSTGKRHESILQTLAEPIHIQTAALLLLRQPINTNDLPQLRILVELRPGEIIPAERLIDNIVPGVKVPPGVWRFNGSRLVDGIFLAQRDGSIIAIMADPDALIETGRIAADNDDNWRPHTAGLPAVGGAVQIILSFEEEPKTRN